MKIQTITPKKAVNKAYLKERINRTDMDKFKQNLVSLFDCLKVSEKESEAFYKNIVSDFLKNTFYTPSREIGTQAHYEVNTKGREDLIIHTGKTTKDNVGVIFETKRPNSSEMLTEGKPNVKALHQLIFYYLQERIDHKNIAVKHLIVTDICNWYIFDENLFDKHIYKNETFIKGYEIFKQSGKNTDFFYKEVAKPILDGLEIELECTHFDLKNFEKTVRNDNLEDDKQLIALYKILSPVHLLKLPFANDSNQLDKNFYTELLHIIGLEEVKGGSKKLIKRKAKPDEFSLLENTMTKIENRGFSTVTDLHKLGTNKAEQVFNIALELSITWVNRVLFLKLLEAQLITYHKGDPSFRFLNSPIIYDYDCLNKLFFEVLAEKEENRRGKVKAEFSKIPYLNSSLFERTDLERKTIEINCLDDGETIPILTNTVLKDDKGKRKTGNLPTLQYLFAFLDSYDFASEGTEGIQDDKRTLINASVLGLIFEKINGYKDGSFFTPGFITMYICRETIRRAVVQKFKETNLPNFQNLVNFDDLKDAITDRKQANALINSLKICDPAVGSGHFLVSALNEIIAIKSDLDVLSYRDGSRVKYYKVEIQNDELIVIDEENGDIFQYFVNEKGVPPKELQKLQETLFHEKQTIIENCLFGVDINPNSVKICRLRLWIELLKNTYYTEGSQFMQLETLPNIDINIKQGNSLISRFKLDDDLSAFITDIKDIKDNVIFSDAFEWRFEFPEVLDTEGGYVGFDVVIGNPPYVGVRQMELKSRQFYKSKFQVAKDQYDLYVLFIERSFEIMKEFALFGFITPDKFLVSKYGKYTFDYLSKNAKAVSFWDLTQMNVFEEASVYPVITILQKDSVGSIINNEVLNKLEITAKVNDKWYEKIEKVNLMKLDFDVWRPLATSKEVIDGNDSVISNSNISRYVLSPISNKTTTTHRVIDAIFPKILLKKLCYSLEASIDENGLIPVNTTYCLTTKAIDDLLYILGVLNSKLLTFYVRKKYISTALRGGYIELRVFQLKELPIYVFNEKNKITNLVKQILSTKQSTPSVSTVDLEHEIDKLVYGLYGLTEEEIEIIEQTIK